LNANAATGAGNTSIHVGGVWLGPVTSPIPSQFPFSFISSQTTLGQIPVRVSGTGISSTTIALTNNKVNITWRGYKTTLGDCDVPSMWSDPTCKWNITATTNTLALFNNTGAGSSYYNIDFSSNGQTGANALVAVSAQATFMHCIFRASRGFNLSVTAGGANVIENELYDCNKGNSANQGCLNIGAVSTVVRNWIHNSTGSVSQGITVTAGASIFGNVISSCVIGMRLSLNVSPVIENNTIFNSSASVLINTSAGTQPNIYFNRNLLDGARNYCVSVIGSSIATNLIRNNNFYFNCTNGNDDPRIANSGYSDETNATTLTTEPLRDPTNGNFQTINSALFNLPFSFIQTDTRYSNNTTKTYNDAGAIQHFNSGVFSVYVQ
jgi:hypothetical protein